MAGCPFHSDVKAAISLAPSEHFIFLRYKVLSPHGCYIESQLNVWQTYLTQTLNTYKSHCTQLWHLTVYSSLVLLANMIKCGIQLKLFVLLQTKKFAAVFCFAHLSLCDLANANKYGDDPGISILNNISIHCLFINACQIFQTAAKFYWYILIWVLFLHSTQWKYFLWLFSCCCISVMIN